MKFTTLCWARNNGNGNVLIPCTEDGRKERESFLAFRKEGETIKCTYEIITPEKELRERRRRHYYAYLGDVLSEFDFSFIQIDLKRKMVNQLHEYLKSQACLFNSKFCVPVDTVTNDGIVRTYAVFSTSGDGANPLELSNELYGEYIEWAFDTLVRMQEQLQNRHIEPYGGNE